MTSRRRLRPEEARLWAMVASTVQGAPRFAAPEPDVDEAPAPPSPATPATPRARVSAEALTQLVEAGVASRAGNRPIAVGVALSAAAPIEPNRRRRIARDRDPIGARLDLHGHDQDAARAALHAFIARSQEQGARAVLVITGQGRTGGGVLRLRTPDWLAEPPSRARVAGVSIAEARHGGEGALYVALKRRPSPS